jgi:TPR repeat protein
MPDELPPSRDKLRLLLEGVEAGEARAQRELAMCCHTGAGVPQNYTESARLFRLAADQGDANAQCMLATCYLAGLGLQQDKGEGLRRMTLAAEQGHEPSHILLVQLNRAAGGPAAAVPREAARFLARNAQRAVGPEHHSAPETRAMALALLGKSAHDRNVARTCCIGCGKTEQLQVCAKCLTAKFCSRECQIRMWPKHKQACKAWAEQKAAATAEAGGASSSALAESGEEQAEEEGGGGRGVSAVKSSSAGSTAVSSATRA